MLPHFFLNIFLNVCRGRITHISNWIKVLMLIFKFCYIRSNMYHQNTLQMYFSYRVNFITLSHRFQNTPLKSTEDTIMSWPNTGNYFHTTYNIIKSTRVTVIFTHQSITEENVYSHLSTIRCLFCCQISVCNQKLSPLTTNTVCSIVFLLCNSVVYLNWKRNSTVLKTLKFSWWIHF